MHTRALLTHLSVCAHISMKENQVHISMKISILCRYQSICEKICAGMNDDMNFLVYTNVWYSPIVGFSHAVQPISKM